MLNVVLSRFVVLLLIRVVPSFSGQLYIVVTYLLVVVVVDKCSEFSESDEESTDLMCCECIRSKRPKLYTILELLLSLQKIPAR